MALLTLAAFPLSYLAYVSIQEQVKEARIQSEAAQKQAAVALQSQRPWVYMSGIKVKEVGPNNPGWYMVISSSISNPGNAPALAVETIAKVVPARFGETVRQTQRDICEKPSAKKGSAIFPGDKRQIDFVVDVEPSVMDYHPGEAVLVVLGCTKYRSASDGSEHSTGFAYYLAAEPIPGVLTPLPRDLEKITLSKTGVRLWDEEGAFAAN